MLVPDINDDGVVVARGIATVVNRSEDDHYEVLAVVLNVLHLLLDVPCVELWDIVYFVPEEDIALLLRYSKHILCNMVLELSQVTIAFGVLFQEGRVWIGILEWLDVVLCQGVVVALCSNHFMIPTKITTGVLCQAGSNLLQCTYRLFCHQSRTTIHTNRSSLW